MSEELCQPGNDPIGPIAVRVVETPLMALQRLALTPDVPHDEMREAVAAAVININERIEALERQGRIIRSELGRRA